MLNCEGRIREERPAKGKIKNCRATEQHLTFSDHGIVGSDPDGAAGIHGKKRLLPKDAEEVNLRGKRVVSEEELHARSAAKHGFGIRKLKQFTVPNDGAEKPRGPPPGANLTSRERAEKIVATALSSDPSLAPALAACQHQGGEERGVFDAVKLVQRVEAAKHIAIRDTQPAHLRSADEPSHLMAPFATKTTRPETHVDARFSKRMLHGPDEQPEKPYGIRRVAADARETPFDTKVARFYPDPPEFGKGREIWSAQGKRRVDQVVAPHDLDEMAQRKAVARCGKAAAEQVFPEFVLGEPSPAPLKGKAASPQKNLSSFGLGAGAAAPPAPPRSAAASTASSAANGRPSTASSTANNTRCGYAHLKNFSSKLW